MTGLNYNILFEYMSLKKYQVMYNYIYIYYYKIND